MIKMERYIADHIQPKFDALDRRLDKLENRQHDLATKLTMSPNFDLEITGNSPDFILETARRAYDLFGARTNFNLKARLSEVVETAAEGENNG